MLNLSLFVCAMMAVIQVIWPGTISVSAEGEHDIPHGGTDIPTTTEIRFDEEGELGIPHGGTDIPFTTDVGGWQPSCPDGWTMADIRCLLYVSEEMTFENAQSHCHSKDGYLASFVPFENDLPELIPSSGKGKIWVSGCDGEDLNWAVSGKTPGSEEAKKTCAQKTGNKIECSKSSECEAKLPFLCSQIIM